MADVHDEVNVGVEICAHLAAHGWRYAPDDAVCYDRCWPGFRRPTHSLVGSDQQPRRCCRIDPPGPSRRYRWSSSGQPWLSKKIPAIWCYLYNL